MNPAGISLVILCAAIIFMLPRRGAVLGVMLTVCYVTQRQQVDVLGFHFTLIRIALMVGLIRVLVRGEIRQLQLNAIDKAILAYATALVVIYTLRLGTTEAFVFVLGCAYDILLSYFVFRCLITSAADVTGVLSGLAFLIVPLALLMCWEATGAKNVFSVFGGVAEFAEVRDGHVRCSGPFRSPITAGSLGASFAVLYLGLWWRDRGRRPLLIGLAASLAILIMSHSSGPILAFGGGLIALAFWRLRGQMRRVRWGIALTLVGLHLVMKAPVWFLIAKVSDIVGGGGYHRAALIDQFINHFWSWGFLGTSDTGGWMATTLLDGMADLTNAFVAAGVSAGLVGFLLFVSIFVKSFQLLGRARQTAVAAADSAAEWLTWVLGAALFAHALNIISVTYFDQMYAAYYMFLALVAAVAGENAGELSQASLENLGSLDSCFGSVPAVVNRSGYLVAD